MHVDGLSKNMQSVCVCVCVDDSSSSVDYLYVEMDVERLRPVENLHGSTLEIGHYKYLTYFSKTKLFQKFEFWNNHAWFDYTIERPAL